MSPVYNTTIVAMIVLLNRYAALHNDQIIVYIHLQGSLGKGMTKKRRSTLSTNKSLFKDLSIWSQLLKARTE